MLSLALIAVSCHRYSVRVLVLVLALSSAACPVSRCLPLIFRCFSVLSVSLFHVEHLLLVACSLADVTQLSSCLAISIPLQIARTCFTSGALHICFFAESLPLVIRDSLLALAIFLRQKDGSKRAVWAIITKQVHAQEPFTA